MSKSSNYRYTKIIFTIGPATESEEMIEQLILAGADVCRLNMAHANHTWTRNVIRRVHAVGERVKRSIPIMMDVKGPEIRTGDLPEPIELEAGELFDFVCDKDSTANADANIRSVTVNYPGLNNDIRVGDTILVDSGLIRLECLEVFEDRVRGKVIIPGPMGNRRHINLPGVHVNLPSLTEKDKADIAVGVEEGIEFYALSFARTAEDLDQLKAYLKDHGSNGRVIAKIEDQSAIKKLHSIIRACDGLMVARGDLGIECPYEQLPVIQKRAVRYCINQGKPVIVATNMLESMTHNPLPTRAEITDVSNAVLEQADCVMLSGETTVGKYPVECVQAMHRIAMQCQQIIPEGYNNERILSTPRLKLLRSAAQLAHETEGASLLIFTKSGHLPRVLSSLRPFGASIYAFTEDPTVFLQMNILWGVEPFQMKFAETNQETVELAINELKAKGWVQPHQYLVVITNTTTSSGATVETIQMRAVEADDAS